ncbi:MAG: type IV pilus modification PilV family protein [Limisphaerales bacterium]
MKLRFTQQNTRFNRAFTLIEVIVCTAILAIAVVSLYGGISSSFAVLNSSRENLRANQVLVEKLETIRLYNWDQVNSNGFIAPTFTAPFFPAVITTLIGTNSDGSAKFTYFTNGTGSGLTYHGLVQITNAPFTTAYSTNLRMVTVTLTWTNRNSPRTRQMQTLISANGLQDYIFN